MFCVTRFKDCGFYPHGLTYREYSLIEQLVYDTVIEHSDTLICM